MDEFNRLVNEFEEAVREMAWVGSREPSDRDLIKNLYKERRKRLLDAEGIIRNLRNIHSRALACHCECLGMNAENALAVCGNYSPPYNDAAFFSIMEKWGLSDKDGNPTI